MANWVVDKGLDVLLAQINAAAPGRSKASDGSIGDPAHQATESDHNPEHPAPPGNPDYQVDARDFTHDPAHGADMGMVSEAIRRSHDPRVAYVIFSRRIYSGNPGPAPWTWRTYTGSDPHTNHMHVSVLDLTHDQTQPWQIGIDMTTPTGPQLPTGFNTNVQQLFGRVGALFGNQATVGWPDAPRPAEPNLLKAQLDRIEAKLDVLATKPVIDGPTVRAALADAGLPELVAEAVARIIGRALLDE
jgi:hypothetical protein